MSVPHINHSKETQLFQSAAASLPNAFRDKHFIL